MPKSIMIINSNPEVAQKIAVNLSSPNTEIVYVFSMVEALKTFTQKEFCLIILDAAISAEDDHQLLAAIRKSKTIPILILSSQSCHVERLQVFSREQLYNHVWEEHSAYNVDEVVKAQRWLIIQPERRTNGMKHIGMMKALRLCKTYDLMKLENMQKKRRLRSGIGHFITHRLILFIPI